MFSIQQTCQPHQDILQGSFNRRHLHRQREPGGGSLSRETGRHACALHRCRAVLSRRDVRHGGPAHGPHRCLQPSRRAEHSAPALHRLETAFGGGKTHTLIALTHLGFRGRDLAAVTQGIIDPRLLHAPGEVTVVGIAGDGIPVDKPQGSDLAPYTIWGELAYQIGGESLYRQVETAATSPAAPDRRFFEHITGGAQSRHHAG